MSRIRFALAQMNPVVGDIEGNSTLIRDAVRDAVNAHASVVVFPEMALTGYPIEDLAYSPEFVGQSQDGLDALATSLRADGFGDIAVIVGYIRRAKSASFGGAIAHNSLAVLFDGRVESVYDKLHLPNYSVFDEKRVFVPGRAPSALVIGGVKVGFLICEDLWRDRGPVETLAEQGLDAVIVINASPFDRTKDDNRFPLLSRRAQQFNAPVAYVNLVGGQDDLIFDGDSAVVDARGSVVARANRFESTTLYHDIVGTSGGAGLPVRARSALNLLTPMIAGDNDELADIWSALVLGVRDYVEKNRFPSVTLGLSGGIDSAVCAVLAADAIGAERVFGVSMPSQWSSDHSKGDAADLARRIGCGYTVEPIGDLVGPFESQLGLTGLAAENIQARARGMILMALSNQRGHLVLTTGNKSEVAVGYCTMYGDTVGGYAPLKDVPKTLVWQLAEWRNATATARGQTPPIPENSISKPPSAELRPGQVDQDSLPPYDVLDAILERLIERRESVATVVAAGFDGATVERIAHLVSISEWKRRQGAIGPRISRMAFGRERRLPITVRRTNL
ncbi:MAG: NAD+ synthase [Microbacteriaceae bacterium]